MKSVLRIWNGVVCALVLSLVPLAVGQSAALQAGLRLYEQQSYVAAQEALLKIDRDALTADERAKLDETLAALPEAIKGAERASQDLADADQAYEAGEWEHADRLYQAVCDNRYALGAQHERATTQHQRVQEKRKLADAARPSGTIEERRVTVTVTEEPAPAAPEAAPTSAPAVTATPIGPEGPRRLTPTDQLRIRDELLWQQALTRAEDLARKARAAASDQDFREARKLVDSAVQIIEAAAGYAEPASKYEMAREEIVRLKSEIEASEQDYGRENAEREREEIKRRVEQRKQAMEAQREETVEQLFNSAEQLRRERKFAEAAEVLRQILRLDPANAKARDQLDVAEDYESFDSQQQWKRDKGAEGRRALLQADEALIPWDYDILYPKNWLELSERRRAKGVQTGAQLEDLELNRKLDEVLPEARFDETPFEQVVDFLTDYTKLNISVDWTGIQDAIVDDPRVKPVTLRLTSLSLRTVLREVLAQVGGETELAFSVGSGLIRVSTREKLNKEKLVLIYDIRDLLAIIPQAGQPDYTQNQGLQAGGQGGSGSQSIFGQNQQQQQQGQDQLGGQAEINRIKEIIRQTVEPDSWTDSGAGPGGATIQDLNGQLLIYNTSDAHRQVKDLLSQLRETQALQVSVEARFLDVVQNFLEQFGVDLDFVFNSGSAGYDRAPGLSDPFTGAPVLMPRSFSRTGSLPATPGFGVPIPQGTPTGQPYGAAGLVPASGGIIPQISEMTPISAQQSSLSLVDPSGINTQVPGSWAQRSSLAPALNIAGSFLDNLQVDFLIRATQANSRSSIVQAPRAVMLNGQAVEIRVEQVRRYVSSLEPVVGENAALPRPIPADANSGISMWVQGVISADRRYTKLSISLLQQGEPAFDTFELQRASGNSPSIFILLPRFSRTTFTTTVSIPDGGTVLLGGFKQVGEVEVEAGVPILSKIPVLKRAFTNQTTVKDTRTLLILVKAKILIQQEAEEEAFPTFSRIGG